MTSWHSVTGEFCESLEFGKPEYANAFSSLAICMFGFFGLFLSNGSELLSRFIYALIATNSIGSFGYHWTLEFGWGIVDQGSMLIAVVIGNIMLYDEIMITWFHQKKYSLRFYTCLSGLMMYLFSIYLIFTLSLLGVPTLGHAFSILFAVPMLTLIPGILISRYITHKKFVVEHPEVFKYMWIGILMVVVVAIIWFVTEFLCKLPQNHWMAYLFAHPIWHFGMSYGIHMIVQVLIFLKNIRQGRSPYLYGQDINQNSCCSRFKKYFYKFVPIVDCYDYEKNDQSFDYLNKNVPLSNF